MSGGIERQKGVLPGAPSSRVFITGCVDAFIETNANTERRLRGGPAETQGQHEAALASRQANFAGEGYIAIARMVVTPTQLVMLPEILPAIRGTDEADRSRGERSRTTKGKRCSSALGKEHRHTLVIVDPGRIAGALIHRVRRQKRIKPIVGYGASERLKRYALKHDVAARIGEHQFFDPITTLVTDTADDKRRHAFGDRMNGTLRIALLFREETMPIGNDEAQIPRACLIDPRIVDLVEDAVAQREPDSALRLQRGTDTAFGARCPSRIAARPPRCSVLEGH